MTETEHTDPVQARRAYKFRAHPACPQEGRPAALLRDHCDLYDAALEGRREAWKMRHVSASCGMQRFSQVAFVAGGGSKWEPSRDTKRAYATFRAAGRVKVKQHRPVRGAVKTPSLKREGRRWYIIATAETDPARAKPGSGNRKRLRRALAREWRKVRNRRRDFHHKTARALVRSCDVIALEKLNTAGMTRRPAPKPDPAQPGAPVPNRAAARAGLNRPILDAGWAQFAAILAAKAEEAGRRVMFVNPAGTSITCHRCGRRCERPQQKTVICPEHGSMDADADGAQNIAARAGLGPGQVATAA